MSATHGAKDEANGSKCNNLVRNSFVYDFCLLAASRGRLGAIRCCAHFASTGVRSAFGTTSSKGGYINLLLQRVLGTIIRFYTLAVKPGLQG